MDDESIKIPSGPEPIYQAIAQAFRSKVSAGAWKSGERIPTEEQLCHQLGVSRGTLRKAVGALVEEGILERVQGKGTFVATDKVSYPFAQELVSFAEEMRRRGQDFHTTVISSMVTETPSWLLKKLNAPEGSKVLAIERARDVNGTPAVLMRNWVLLSKCPGLEHEDFTKVGLFEAIEKRSGQRIKYGVRDFSARILDAEQAALVGRKAGDPIMFMTQTTYGQDNEPIEHSNFLLRTDQYQVTSILYR